MNISERSCAAIERHVSHVSLIDIYSISVYVLSLSPSVAGVAYHLIASIDRALLNWLLRETDFLMSLYQLTSSEKIHFNGVLYLLFRAHVFPSCLLRLRCLNMDSVIRSGGVNLIPLLLYGQSSL